MHPPQPPPAPAATHAGRRRPVTGLTRCRRGASALDYAVLAALVAIAVMLGAAIFTDAFAQSLRIITQTIRGALAA